MLNIELDGSEPEHVERIEPKMSTDAQGNISWVPSLLDHNAKVFHRGKTVTNEEFNELFLHQVYRGNYLTDSLSKFFEAHLSNAIRGKFRSDFKLIPSYIKTFTSADWGTLQDDGYYYINIPAEEHGFTIDTEEAALDRINIDIEMYLLSPEGLFYEVTQAHIDTDNTVQIYTDDNTVPGFIVIRANEKAYALVDVTIGANQVDGLHAVATSGKYADLIDINAANGPNTKIKQNTTAIQAILDGYKIVDDVQEEVRVALADKANESINADNLTGSINNIDIKDILEDSATSYIVKEATLASNYKAGGSIANKLNEVNTNLNSVNTTLTNAINTVKSDIQNGTIVAQSAQSAQSAQDYAASGTIINKFNSIDNTIASMNEVLYEGSEIATTDGVEYHTNKPLTDGDVLDITVGVYVGSSGIPNSTRVFRIYYRPNYPKSAPTYQDINLSYVSDVMGLAVNFYGCAMRLNMDGTISVNRSHYKQLGTTTQDGISGTILYRITRVQKGV